MSTGADAGLTVAVTGCTGELGRPLLAALDRSKEVGRVVGMARRSFDPSKHGLRKVEYRRGNVTNRRAVDELVRDVDVVVHLAFVVMEASDKTRRVNVDGSKNVFEAAKRARVQRVVHASSVAAYGYHAQNSSPLTEETATRGNDEHPYSAQKAEVEAILDEVLGGRAGPDVYCLRPCVVSGPEATLLIDALPYVRMLDRLPARARQIIQAMPLLRPVIPDSGVPFQLVHHDDVATALRACILGRGAPGAYNLAGEGEVTPSDVADELGWYAIPVPSAAFDAAARVVRRLPFLPPEASWIEALRRPVIMETAKARRELRWRPRHDARSTLKATVEAAEARNRL